MSPMKLFWLECGASEIPLGTAWLSGQERAYCSRLRISKRRDDRLLGRWTAKCAIAALLRKDVDVFPRITILPDSSGAPVATIGELEIDLSVSISHRASHGLAVLTLPKCEVGGDLEFIEPRSSSFSEDYFTPAEREQLRRTDTLSADAMANLIWSAKESVLKLVRLGLMVDTRSVSITLSTILEPGSDWKRFEATFADVQTYSGWWQQVGNWARTQVGSHASSPPIALRDPS